MAIITKQGWSCEPLRFGPVALGVAVFWIVIVTGAPATEFLVGQVMAQEKTATSSVPAIGDTVEWVFSEACGDRHFTRTEVTVSQFMKCVDAGRCDKTTFETYTSKKDVYGCNYGRPQRDNHPMNCVTYHGAKQFCRWAGGKIIDETSWRKEATNDGARPWPWDANEKYSCERAIVAKGRNNVCGCGRQTTWPVCSRPSGNSVSGLCDMIGNVSEWVTASMSVGRALNLTQRDCSSIRCTATAGLNRDGLRKQSTLGIRCMKVMEK